DAAAGAGRDAIDDSLVLVVCDEHQDLDSCRMVDELLDQRDCTVIGKLHVDESDMRSYGIKANPILRSCMILRRCVEIRNVGENSRQTIAEETVAMKDV